MVCGTAPATGSSYAGEPSRCLRAMPFSIYALAALIPILPAKQRLTHHQRLDDNRHRHRVSRPQLRRKVPHHTDWHAHVPSRRVTAVPLPTGCDRGFHPYATCSRLHRLAASCRAGGSWPRPRSHRPGRRVGRHGSLRGAGITTFDCANIYTGVRSSDRRVAEAARRSGHRARAGAHASTCPTSIVCQPLPGRRRCAASRPLAGAPRTWTVSTSSSCTGGTTTCRGYVDAAAWLDELRRAGKIRHLGLTNFATTL
jgi:hypothetical protein